MLNRDVRLHSWYYVVGIEIETIVAADYPASAESCLHAVFHKMLDPLDRHKFPRVVCNLVQNVDGWEQFDPKLSALARAIAIRPVKETTIVAGKHGVRLTSRRK